jgi:hypothetical protein
MSAQDVGRILARTYLAAIAATVLVMAVVLAVGAQAAREWLGFPITGVPVSVSRAAAISADNARLMAGGVRRRNRGQRPVAGSPGMLGHPRCRVEGEQAAVRSRAGHLLCSNVVIVGAALAAYRARMVAAILPHGPVELLGFACPITLYLLARRGPVPARTWPLLAGAATAALATGAVLEVFVAAWGSGVR